MFILWPFYASEYKYLSAWPNLNVGDRPVQYIRINNAKLDINVDIKGYFYYYYSTMFSLSPILTGFGKSFVDNSCGTVGSRHQGAVTCASSCLAFACRQLVQLTEKVWKPWLFLHFPNFIIPSCLWKSLFTSASLRDLMCEVNPHYQSRYTCRGLTDWQLSGLWVVCRAVEKRLFWDQHSDL